MINTTKIKSMLSKRRQLKDISLVENDKVKFLTNTVPFDSPLEHTLYNEEYKRFLQYSIFRDTIQRDKQKIALFHTQNDINKESSTIYRNITKDRKLKNGKTIKCKYKFKSDTPEFNYLYGITPHNIREVDYKISKQRLFLNNTFLLFGEDDSKIPLSKTVMTPNLTPSQYHGEIWNRIEALRRYAKDLNFLCPVFCTVTPQTKFKPLKQREIKSNVVHMIDNKNFNSDSDFVKHAMSDLSDRFSRFRRSNVMQSIYKEYGSRPIYMKTVEPTLDGVPHIHFIMYVPYSHLDKVTKAIKNNLGKESKVHYKTSFKDDAGGAVAYIMKYILKSFKNQKTDKINLIGYWFAKHNIRRFTTSRTLAPLQIFRKIRHKEEYQDYYKVSRSIEKEDICVNSYTENKAGYLYRDDNKKIHILDRAQFRALVTPLHQQHGYIHKQSGNTISYDHYKSLDISSKIKYESKFDESTFDIKPLIIEGKNIIYQVYAIEGCNLTTGETIHSILYEKREDVKIIQRTVLTDNDDNRLSFIDKHFKRVDKNGNITYSDPDSLAPVLYDYDLICGGEKWRYIEKIGNYFQYQEETALSKLNQERIIQNKPTIDIFPSEKNLYHDVNTIELDIDGRQYILFDDGFTIDERAYRSARSRSDYDLQTTFMSMDFIEDEHLWITYRNEMVRRGLLKITNEDEYISYSVLDMF